ncbi:MAG: hypothetical protein KAS64_00925 [Spirochaetes bacterium]|nr:hypothetical protein [Spirochaetota bacterium]
MQIIYYQDQIDKELGTGSIIRFFKQLRNERPPNLWVMVKETLEKVGRSSNLDDLKRQGLVKRMAYTETPKERMTKLLR